MKPITDVTLCTGSHYLTGWSACVGLLLLWQDRRPIPFEIWFN